MRARARVCVHSYMFMCVYGCDVIALSVKWTVEIVLTALGVEQHAYLEILDISNMDTRPTGMFVCARECVCVYTHTCLCVCMVVMLSRS